MPIPGTTNLRPLGENLGTVNVELTPEGLREFDEAASEIDVQGARYPEKLEVITGRQALRSLGCAATGYAAGGVRSGFRLTAPACNRLHRCDGAQGMVSVLPQSSSGRTVCARVGAFSFSCSGLS